MTDFRYSRQTNVKQFGVLGQKTLAQKKAVIIGGGGLGSHSADILTRTGIGEIDIYDADMVNLSNLHRTAIFSEKDVGHPKVEVLQTYLSQVNSSVEIHGFIEEMTAQNIVNKIADADIILDGTDDMELRFLINEASVKQNVPWVYAGVDTTTGMIMAIKPGVTACLKCITQGIPKPTGVIPVFSTLPKITAAIQCNEACKLLLDQESAGFIVYDVWTQRFDQINMKRNPQCSCCMHHDFEFLVGET